VDTHILNELPLEPWWLLTHYSERSFMPRHYSCDPLHPKKTCTLRELQQMLPSVQAQGYNVVNVDWPVEASPDSLYEGFGAKDYMNVDPALGTRADWLAFVGEAHNRDLRVVADFNPSYFWTGAPAFQQAVQDVRQYGVSRDKLPKQSPARWFRWAADCPAKSPTQPPDNDPQMGMTNGWVKSPAAGGACYWSIWGAAQPCGDLASPEWQAELTNIIKHWAGTLLLDGFMLDAPGFYLAYNGSDPNPISGLHDAVIAELISKVIVEPAHTLGAAVFGELYNLGRPPLNKVLDGGRNTDMPDPGNGGDSYPGFPGLLHAMVVAEDASGLEALLTKTVDVLGGWSAGGGVRTVPDSRGNATIASQKAAVTALLAGYYVVRMGPDCKSPYSSYPKPGPGDEWPGGCYGKWIGATDVVAATLKAARTTTALRPGTPRHVLNTTAKGYYAALRTESAASRCTRQPGSAADDKSAAAAGDAAAVVAVFNFQGLAADVSIDLAGSAGGEMIAAPQTTTDLIAGGDGPPVPASGLWRISVPAHGWRVLTVRLIPHVCI
jgi:hypothetical protein